MDPEKIRVTALLLITVFIINLPGFVSLTPAMAKEYEEEDSFTRLPNYRWENQTTTDSAIIEQLDGDIYGVYNNNNETSGNHKFEKSRKLNSRDFYFESRFGIDIGGNQTEYFRDQLGDPCDFTEDNEGSTVGSQDGGYLKRSASGYAFVFRKSVDFTALVFHTFEIRFKIIAAEDTDLGVTILYYNDYNDNTYRRFSFTVTTNQFHTITTNFLTLETDPAYSSTADNGYSNDTITDIAITMSESISYTFYLDYAKILGDFDFFTSVESETEDTLNFDDSVEYFYDEINNVSDFNDGTTEQWVASGLYTDQVFNENGWLVLNVSNTNFVYWQINATALTIVSSTYNWFAMEYYCVETNPSFDKVVHNITIMDDAGNRIYNDATSKTNNTKYLMSVDLSLDADWSGTESGLKVKFDWDGGGTGRKVFVNFTYLYSAEKGDLESFSGLNREHIDPAGYYVGTCSAAANDAVVTKTGLSVDSDHFTHLKLRLKTYSSVYFLIKGYDGSTYDELSSLYYPTVNVWNEYEIDLSNDADYQGTYDRFWIQFDESDGTLDGDELIIIDYFILVGHWSEDDGFKFGLLNEESEEGMYFQFTRDQDSDDYTLNIDLLDASGIASSHGTVFEYSYASDAFLNIRTEYNIDKKMVNINFEYDNSTEILSTAVRSEIWSPFPVTQLKLNEEGFPQLCMNNSAGPLALSVVYIDYIDADFQEIDFRESEEGESHSFVGGIGSFSVNTDSGLTSYSPYGIVVDNENVTDAFKMYELSADRFDGLSVDLFGCFDGIDANDWYDFELAVYNVLDNGTAIRVMSLLAFAQAGPLLQIGICDSSGNFIYDTSDSATVGFDASFSIYYESKNELIGSFSVDTTDYSGSTDEFVIVSTRDSFNYTKEFFFEFCYITDTINSGASNDLVKLQISDLKLVRKDLLMDLAMGLLGLVPRGLAFNPTSLLLLPLIIILNALLAGFFQLANVIYVLFKPLIDPVFGILQDIYDYFDALDFEQLFQNVVDAVNSIQGWLTTLGSTLTTWWNNNIVPILNGLDEAIWAALVAALATITNFCADIIFGLYDGFWALFSLSPPDLIAITEIFLGLTVDVANGLPAFITDLISLLFAWFIFIPIIMFAYNWLVPALISSNIGEFAKEFVNIAKMDVTGGTSFLGFRIPVPFIVVWMFLLSIYAAGNLGWFGGSW